MLNMEVDGGTVIEPDSLKDQKRQLEAAVDSLDTLRVSIDQAASLETLALLAARLEQVETTVEQSTATLLPPPGLSSSDYNKAVRVFVKLPLTSRLALCEALNVSDVGKSATSWDRAPGVVYQLYKDRSLMTSQRLQDALKSVELRREARRRQILPSPTSVSASSSEKLPTSNKLMSIFDESKTFKEGVNEGTVQQLLGRVTRKEGRVATEDDLATLMTVLGKETFVPSGKEAISGGYILRGKNTKQSGKELIEALDAKLPVSWSAQVSLLPDVTNLGDFGDGFGPSEPVLLLLKKDLSATTSRWISSFTTAAAVISAYVFSVGVYGGNDVVTNRLTEMTELSDFSELTRFNGSVLEVLIPLGIIQALHQLAQYAVAAKDDIKISPPMVLPFFTLPFMGTQTGIKESPKNLTSLFDFAFVGPFVGILASLAFLVVGLQATATVDAEAAQYLPALPVSVIKLSSLGAGIMETFMGGEGSITLQDAKTAIPLHPYAIAGFTSLMINALGLLPLGSTDGGRMSLSLLGRKGHSIVGGSVWAALLVSSFFQEGTDVLVGAWIVNNIVENDPEVPCRNETDEVNLPRVFLATSLWFVGILALVPIV